MEVRAASASLGAQLSRLPCRILDSPIGPRPVLFGNHLKDRTVPLHRNCRASLDLMQLAIAALYATSDPVLEAPRRAALLNMQDDEPWPCPASSQDAAGEQKVPRRYAVTVPGSVHRR